ncbi:MAG: hypothetical protein KGJ60_12875 [Verrucomicrobiota bacterium]|nr:hypothetical protein [Verrucomicrobiota bacterium]
MRRFLKHPRFNTRAQRRGIVARVHHDGIAFWQRHRPTLQTGHGFAPRNDGAPIFNRLGRSFKQKAGCKPALQAVLQIPLAHGNTALETRALVLVMAESKNGAVPFVFGNNAIEIALRPLRKGFGKQFCRPGTWCDNSKMVFVVEANSGFFSLNLLPLPILCGGDSTPLPTPLIRVA